LISTLKWQQLKPKPNDGNHLNCINNHRSQKPQAELSPVKVALPAKLVCGDFRRQNERQAMSLAKQGRQPPIFCTNDFHR
jgi:hypothetical protein